MKWALVDGGNVVCNIIVYEKDSDYSPPEGFKLAEVEDDVSIGDVLSA